MSAGQKKPFLEALAEGPVLFDGAMGTLLYERGVLHTRSYDELVLSQPDLIRKVHLDYLAAGAQVIETDTFGANRIALARHGIADQMAQINKSAVKLAREASAGRAWVAGAVGPTGVRYAIATEAERRRARLALAEQIDTLVIAGVDLILLETFPSILELETAIAVAKERGPKVPVVAQHVFDPAGKGDGGLAPSEVAERLIACGADVIGANCGAGPAELYAVGTAMIGRGKPVIVQPNAGMPSLVEGRTIYVANPEHFGVFARRMLKSGIRAIGGCCGTTPEHIRTMLGAIRMMGGVRIDQIEQKPNPTQGSGPETPELRVPPPPAVPLAERSRLGARIAKGELAVSVELTAPAGTDLTKTKAQVQTLLAGGVDIVNIADGPRASARMANVAVCARLAAETGVEPILHVCARDRNFLGLVAHLLGAAALGLRDLVIITGDPPKMGDYPFATPVYDVDSIGLLKIARGLNAGFDPAGKPIGSATSFVLATGAEPGAQDYDRELRRLEEKKDAGAEVVMTQPVYDPRTLERFLDDTKGLGLPIMVGILPLASARNAEFLHNEVPGMSIPAEYRARMARVPQGPEARAEGIKIAQEALAAVRHRVAGVYIMPPFNRVESALAVLEAAADRWKPCHA
ncbi:MAG: bifunctional homocysteine S-methyltransferase/methylenetetrahydrofolate reductase [Deltaproteobacteria bacterium]|nr:bifunctional homocysteine S-methyltransferase/methylenetetrahydrofolate reductase [Kofleriaceae bacterium]